MSGNYDHPPASRRARGNRPSDRPPRFTATHLQQHLRDLLTSDRNRDTSAHTLETLNREIEQYRRSQDRSSFEQDRAAVDQQIQQHRSRREDRPHGSYPGYIHPGMQRLQALNVTVVDQDANTPDSSRPPSGPSRRRTMRNGGRSGREVGNRDSNVSSLLDEAVPPLDTSAAIPEPLDSNYQMERWRVKRRKLESDDNREGLQSFRYGHYGQVVPGALKMELASCDGGTYESERDSSWPENILHNDSSIYCTKSGQCNLILKHQGEAPFCLKRIVIKVPKMGYDTPVQEGMVFVSMSSDELLARTAQYQIQPRSGRQRRNRRSGLQPSQEYLNAYRTPLQTLERTGPAGAESHSESDTDINELAGSSADHRSLPRSEFRITTEYDERSEHSDNDEEDFSDSVYSSFANWLQMYQMEDDLLCSESDDSESDGDTPELTTYNRRRRDFQRQVRVMRRRYGMDQEDQSGRRPIPSVIQPTPSSTTAGQRTASDSHNPGSGLLKPHARFSIERTKSMVSVKFDPPPSGRYILIKLWSKSNIDIQSIVAHGFAGPRFFPSGNFR